MILTTATANIRRWLVICPVCKIQLDAFTGGEAQAVLYTHQALHGKAAS